METYGRNEMETKLQIEKPDWIKTRTSHGKNLMDTEAILRKLSLNTVCEEAACPNRCECFGKKTATFMILGKFCTRNCSFCNIEKNKPLPPEQNEPERIALAVAELGLRYVVITSVARDDLEDGGAGHFSSVIDAVKSINPKVTIEALIPDFAGSANALYEVIESEPDIINHNVETVPSLYSTVRPMANYERSLRVLKNTKSMADGIRTKSGIMLGLGETEEETTMVLCDLRSVGCDFLTIGQYLSPSKKHHPVVQYVHPDVFEKLRLDALKMGFMYVASAPLVRSSYMAADMFGDSSG